MNQIRLFGSSYQPTARERSVLMNKVLNMISENEVGMHGEYKHAMHRGIETELDIIIVNDEELLPIELERCHFRS